mgnify:CR=1 FL=1
MDLMLRLQQVVDVDHVNFQGAIDDAEKVLIGLEAALQAKFDEGLKGVRPAQRGQKGEDEPEPPRERRYNLRQLRLDWDEFKRAVDAHLDGEMDTFIPTACSIAEGRSGFSDSIITVIYQLDGQHKGLQKLGAGLISHGLSIPPIRAPINKAISELDDHIRVHELELHPTLLQGTMPMADRRETPDPRRHSSDIARSLRAVERPSPEPEEPEKGLLAKWFGMIREARDNRKR